MKYLKIGGIILAFLIVIALLLPKFYHPHDSRKYKNFVRGRSIANALQLYYENCRKFPLTSEGLVTLQKPACGKYLGLRLENEHFTDIDGAPFLYFSDGNDFQLIHVDGRLTTWSHNKMKHENYPNDFKK